MLFILNSLWPTIFPRRDLQGSYGWGTLFLGAYAFSISYGYFFISAAAGVLIFYTCVVVTMALFSFIKERERITLRLVLGQILGMMGILVITFSGLKAVTWEGAILMIVTGSSWGLYSVYGKNFPNSFGYTYNTFLLLGGGTIPLSLIVSLMVPTQIKIPSLPALGWALFLGMISTALSYALWHRVLQQIKARQGGVAQLLVPLLTALMGIFILGEEINATLMIGGDSNYHGHCIKHSLNCFKSNKIR
jgi:drug/metabolite transporter (DMT)-like permease